MTESECRQAIDALANLQQNWDSYGALPVDPSSIHWAKCVVNALVLWRATMPHVAAVPAGHVCLTWHGPYDSWEASAVVLPCGKLEFGGMDGDELWSVTIQPGRYGRLPALLQGMGK